jgi:hypothetical protein
MLCSTGLVSHALQLPPAGDVGSTPFFLSAKAISLALCALEYRLPRAVFGSLEFNEVFLSARVQILSS